MSIELPILVTPDAAWRATKCRSPQEIYHVAPGAIYLLLGARITHRETNWKRFDFILMDPFGDLIAVGWGAYMDADMDIEYSKFLRGFYPVR